eukprot:TRINITY_DN28836_c0_g1_i1.p1 TRINITY_DN28836_c0_g1~~TRINITY_DN28836_c0_g1_i1.p1  ORF type:complete len:122 (-),score=17.17 TRINITY_DN28836_c0_g1_i1:117-482(-)
MVLQSSASTHQPLLSMLINTFFLQQLHHGLSCQIFSHTHQDPRREVHQLPRQHRCSRALVPQHFQPVFTLTPSVSVSPLDVHSPRLPPPIFPTPAPVTTPFQSDNAAFPITGCHWRRLTTI